MMGQESLYPDTRSAIMSQRLNVLLITVDHWPASLLGCAGHPVVQTPTLDELSRCGTRFTHAYSECPVCIPARRTLLTGMAPRSHGDRTFQTTRPLPDVPTMAECFSRAGYQAFAVGKLHLYPQRVRAGFDDVLLAEEGRPHWGVWDDYDLFLGDAGFVGRQFDHGMSNNQYTARPWHLSEELHVTNWITKQMARVIRRRDPTRPGFWYLSYTHPHPPLVPPQVYWDCYQAAEPPWPHYGSWVPPEWRVGSASTPGPENHGGAVPYRVRQQYESWYVRDSNAVATALRAFYALCTHIDHQLRLVIGTLREERLLDQTVILFSADHGDMLGAHGLWGKRLFYEGSANVPMLLVGPKGDHRFRVSQTDDRLVGWQDIMPTLLDAAKIPIPGTCDGQSLLNNVRRDILYGECNEGEMATRMVHDGQYKMIYYPCGNHRQLFHLRSDPLEQTDLGQDSSSRSILERLTEVLLDRLYGSDTDWIDSQGQLIGLPDRECFPEGNRGLALQRGIHWPPPPVVPPRPGETNPGTN